MPFDSAPVLEQPPTPVARTSDLRTPHVWVFVDETGVVRATQIDRSAGIDYDVAATAQARKLRFRPATAAGRAVPAWLVVAIDTPRPAEPCPTMAVPLSAGFAALTDSAVLERPELGRMYRFRGEKDIGLEAVQVDVFIYPASAWSAPAKQGELFAEAMELQRQAGRISRFEPIDQRSDAPRVGPSSDRAARVKGHVARWKVVTPAGETLETYFAVFPDADRYVKFRATYPPASDTRQAVGFVVGQILAELESRPANCPR
jgi:hypothetical protein